MLMEHSLCDKFQGLKFAKQKNQMMINETRTRKELRTLKTFEGNANIVMKLTNLRKKIPQDTSKKKQQNKKSNL